LVVGKSGAKLKAAKDDEVAGAALSGYVRTFRKLSMVVLANSLANNAGQPVVDNTGLKGLFDFAIDLTPPENDPRPTDRPNDPVSAFARLSSAIEDQLGLKLEPRKITVENLIIDHAERPSAN
jgi:uncharacterized protein (TIGR03435 family)